MTAAWLKEQIGVLTTPCIASRTAVQLRVNDILRPHGALKQLDEIAIWLAGWQRSESPHVNFPVGLIFAADHGVAHNSKVSAYPTDVTASMLAAYRAGRSTVSAFAAVAGAEVYAHDVGVGTPTGDISVEDAMSHDDLDTAIRLGIKAVRRIDCDLLVLGEMGIGNTTIAAAITAALLGGEPSSWVGRGTGIDDNGFHKKCEVVTHAVTRVKDETDPLEILRRLGGREIAAIVGALIEARQRSIPVILDGYVVSSAALILNALSPHAIEHTAAGHCSAESGHRRVLGFLNMHPLLDIQMRLGEGSGAMAAVPLVKMACAGVTAVPTFAEWCAP